MRFAPLVLGGCALAGCVSPWYYEGPDLSAKTLGPVIESRERIINICKVEAYGCFDPMNMVIYMRVDSERNYKPQYCGLPDKEPWTTEEHEWCHARGWRHP